MQHSISISYRVTTQYITSPTHLLSDWEFVPLDFPWLFNLKFTDMCAGAVWSLSHYKRIPFSLSLSIPPTHTHTQRDTHTRACGLTGINLCDYHRTARFESDAGCPPLWGCGILRKSPLCLWSHLRCYHGSLVHKLPLCSLPIKGHDMSCFLKIEIFLLHPNKKPNNPKFQWNRLLEELHQMQIPAHRFQPVWIWASHLLFWASLYCLISKK